MWQAVQWSRDGERGRADRFKAEWLGRGYVDVRSGGKAVRDTVLVERYKFEELWLASQHPEDDY